ncbi:hypothetical protein ACX0HA_05165 [Flavobacterium hauense]
MPSRNELQTIAKKRLTEVKILYRAGSYDGAKYLSGYVIETALKARICKILDSDYPDSGEVSRSFMTHKFETLIKLGGLQKSFDNELNSNIRFKTNWSIVTSWSEVFRYKSIGTSSQADISDVIDALEDRTDGILTWIKKRW